MVKKACVILIPVWHEHCNCACMATYATKHTHFIFIIALKDIAKVLYLKIQQLRVPVTYDYLFTNIISREIIIAWIGHTRERNYID